MTLHCLYEIFLPAKKIQSPKTTQYFTKITQEARQQKLANAFVLETSQ
jgi:hypothetical protein